MKHLHGNTTIATPNDENDTSHTHNDNTGSGIRSFPFSNTQNPSSSAIGVEIGFVGLICLI